MNEINMYVRVHQKYPSNRGKTVILLEYGKYKKHVYLWSITMTHFQSIIIGATEGIRKLKKPCKVNLYTQSNFGFKVMNSKKKWCNREFGDLLLNAIEHGGHKVKYHDCSKSVEGKNKQSYLRYLLDNQIYL